MKRDTVSATARPWGGVGGPWLRLAAVGSEPTLAALALVAPSADAPPTVVACPHPRARTTPTESASGRARCEGASLTAKSHRLRRPYACRGGRGGAGQQCGGTLAAKAHLATPSLEPADLGSRSCGRGLSDPTCPKPWHDAGRRRRRRCTELHCLQQPQQWCTELAPLAAKNGAALHLPPARAPKPALYYGCT